MTAPTHLPRSVLRFLVVALIAASTLLGAGQSAQAHTDLVRSSPAEGDRLETAPREIELEFSEDVDPSLSTVVLSRAGSDPVRLQVVGGGQSAVLLAEVPAVASSDTESWSVGYRVTSVDGHPIEGSVVFVVSGSGSAPTDAGEGPPAEKFDSGSAERVADSPALGTGKVPWQYAGPAFLVAALIMLGTLLGLARLASRARSPHAPSTSGDEAP